MESWPRIVLTCAALCAALAPAGRLCAASTAFRLTDLDLRDPHMYVSFVGCRDITDTALGATSVNGDLQRMIQSDSTADGLLDLSLLIVFDPLDQGGPASAMRFGPSSCSAPLAGTTCGPVPHETLSATTATNSNSGSCLPVLPGTVRPYTPSVVTPAGPCFASGEIPALTLPLLGGAAPVTLRHVQLAATYSGSPATSLVNGELRGFLTEADANATIIAPTFALVGGQPLSVLLPGGDPAGPAVCCASFSDLDTGPASERGWWMYFNFVAQPVPYTGSPVSVEVAGSARLALVSPNPSRTAVAFSFRLESAGPASITVHDLGGRRIAQPLDGWQAAGTHRGAWDGRLDGGGTAAAGMYVIRLSSRDGTIARKVVLLR